MSRFRTATVPTIHATQALEHLHAELAGKLLEAKHESEQLTQSMRHVEAVLKLLHPGYNLATVAVRRRKQNPWFKRGTVLRHVMDALRTAGTPLTPREITDKMLATKGVTDPDRAEFYKLSKSVSSALLCHKGQSIMAHRETAPIRWSLRP